MAATGQVDVDHQLIKELGSTGEVNVDGQLNVPSGDQALEF